QRDNGDRLTGHEQDEHPARLAALLHAGTVRRTIRRVNASDDVSLYGWENPRRPRVTVSSSLDAKSGRPGPWQASRLPVLPSRRSGLATSPPGGGKRPVCKWAESPGRSRSAWPKSDEA